MVPKYEPVPSRKNAKAEPEAGPSHRSAIEDKSDNKPDVKPNVGTAKIDAGDRANGVNVNPIVCTPKRRRIVRGTDSGIPAAAIDGDDANGGDSNSLVRIT